jgi:hypothetical protein
MRTSLHRAAVAALGFLAGAALAPSASADGPRDPAALLGAPLGEAALSGLRARGAGDEELPLGGAGNAGTLTGTNTGGTTGSAVMDGSVLGNSGFTTVFQNTGNNVLFQNTTVVNITVR